MRCNLDISLQRMLAIPMHRATLLKVTASQACYFGTANQNAGGGLKLDFFQESRFFWASPTTARLPSGCYFLLLSVTLRGAWWYNPVTFT